MDRIHKNNYTTPYLKLKHGADVNSTAAPSIST